MFERVEDYLDDLRKALAGADPATVQDALADAEEHLRSGLDQRMSTNRDLGESDALARVVEAYGSPDEVAAAYRQIERRLSLPLAPRPQSNGRPVAVRFFGVFIDPRAYASLFYMFFSFITGIVYFTWAVTGLSLSAGLIVLIIGLPFIALFLLSVQGIALVEGRLIEALLGVRMPRRPIFSKSHLGPWNRLKALIRDRRTWTAILYMVLQLPLGIIYFTIFLTMLSMGLVGIAAPTIQYVFGLPMAQFNNFELYLPIWFIPFLVLVGVMWILLTMHLAKLLGRLHASYAKALLVRE